MDQELSKESGESELAKNWGEIKSKKTYQVGDIKGRRFEWLGSVIRTDQTVVARVIFASKSEGRRKVGRCKMERMIYE
jgi:hypothetical protein